MRVRLLNNGDYVGLDSVNFPVEVEAAILDGDFSQLAHVDGAELQRVGADMTEFEDFNYYTFLNLGLIKEFEIVGEEE